MATPKLKLTEAEREQAERDFRAAIARHKAILAGEVERPDEGAAPTLGDQVALNGVVDDLRQLRESLGMTLDDVSEKTGINRASLSRLENRKNLNPTFGTLSRYAWAVGKTLGFTLDERPQ